MSNPDDADRRLWAAVLLQAADDIANTAIKTTCYGEAVSFFLSQTPYWRRARAELAAHLDIDASQLVRTGRHLVAQRRDKEGLPPLPDPPAPACKPDLSLLPKLLAVLPPEPKRRHVRHKSDWRFDRSTARWTLIVA